MIANNRDRWQHLLYGAPATVAAALDDILSHCALPELMLGTDADLANEYASWLRLDLDGEPSQEGDDPQKIAPDHPAYALLLWAYRSIDFADLHARLARALALCGAPQARTAAAPRALSIVPEPASEPEPVPSALSLSAADARAAAIARDLHTVYVDAAATSKLIRADLRAAFPGIKFGVTTSRYSMGASAEVAWTDGPTVAGVNALVQRYRSKGQMDITDYTPDVYQEEGGQRIHYGTHYVGTTRHYSPELAAAAVSSVCADLGIVPTPKVPITDGRGDIESLYSIFAPGHEGTYHMSLARIVRRHLEGQTWHDDGQQPAPEGAPAIQ